MELLLLLMVAAVILVPIAGFGFILFAVLPRSIKLLKIRLKKVDEYIEEHEKHQQPKRQEPTYDSMQGKWSPTGWIYNEKTGKWDPPDYMNQNIKEEQRLERYRKNREGKPPTYEEWKAAKLAEQEDANK